MQRNKVKKCLLIRIFCLFLVFCLILPLPLGIFYLRLS